MYRLLGKFFKVNKLEKRLHFHDKMLLSIFLTLIFSHALHAVTRIDNTYDPDKARIGDSSMYYSGTYNYLLLTSSQLGNTIKISLGLSVTLLSKMCKIISSFYTIVHTSKIHKLPMYFNITNCELYFGLVIQEYFPIIKYQYSVNSNLVTMFYWPSKTTLQFLKK